MDRVSSKDGTVITFDRLGEGPPVVLVCGGSVDRMSNVGVAELLKTGWKPKRTIVLASWDGEEWGLLGSTEWAEKHAPELTGNSFLKRWADQSIGALFAYTMSQMPVGRPRSSTTRSPAAVTSATAVAWISSDPLTARPEGGSGIGRR